MKLFEEEKRTKLKMRTIRGKVTCEERQDIPEGASATISVIDCSRMDVAAVTLGKVEIQNPKTFPIAYQVDYDDEPIKRMLSGSYAINVRIGTESKLSFITDTRFSIVDQQTGDILDQMDIRSFQEIVQNPASTFL